MEYEHPFNLSGKIVKVNIGDIILFSKPNYIKQLKIQFSAAIVTKFKAVQENNNCQTKVLILFLLTYVFSAKLQLIENKKQIPYVNILSYSTNDVKRACDEKREWTCNDSLIECRKALRKMILHNNLNSSTYNFMLMPKFSLWIDIESKNNTCRILNFNRDNFIIKYNFYCDQQSNSSFRKRYCSQRNDSLVIDNQLRLKEYVLKRIECENVKFKSNCVYAYNMWWYDGLNFEKFHGKSKGSVDKLRFFSMNWKSKFLANAQEHQFFTSYIPSKVDPDSIIELIELSDSVKNIQ